jgi:hypothetical protein
MALSKNKEFNRMTQTLNKIRVCLIILHAKITKNTNFLLKNNNYSILIKILYTFNIKCISSNTNYYFKLFDICKFTHNKKSIR